MNEINWAPEKITNPHFLPLYENKSRYLVLYGGAGSGKSHFAAQKYLLRIILSIQRSYQEKFLFLRRVQRTCRHSVFSLFKHYLQLSGLLKYTSINKTAMSFHFPNGSEILCEGLDDSEKLKSIEGITSVWIEEATELNQDDFNQIDLRPRGVSIPSYVQICLTFNPISKLNWAYKEFFERENDQITLDHSTHKDNLFLDKQYIEVLNRLKETDEIFYRIYALGKWGVLGNLIYTNWVEKKISQNPLDYEIIRIGMDYGFNNPSAIVFLGIKDNDLYIFDEFYQRGLTNNELITKLEPSIIDIKKNLEDKSLIIVGDNAEPARIKEFNERGIFVKPSKKGQDSVKRGIDWIRRRNIYIHPSCVNTKNELSMYKYKEDKDGNILEEPVKFKDHAMDALRYAVEDYVLYGAEDAEVLGVAFA